MVWRIVRGGKKSTDEWEGAVHPDKEGNEKIQRDLRNIKWNACDVDGRTCNLDSFPPSWLPKYGGDDMMPDSSVWAKEKKNLSEFWRVRGKMKPKARWGWASAGRSPKLERKGEKDDRLIYSEWLNQTLKAFGRASSSSSALSLCFTLCSPSLLPWLPSPRKYTFQWSLTKTRPTTPQQTNMHSSLHSS